MNPDNKNLKEELKRIWSDIFGDSEDYINLFFEKVYHPNQAYFIVQNGRIASAMHYIPFKLKIYNKKYKTAYICGVSTYPQYEGKGYMSRLLTACLQDLYKRGYDFACLIPANKSLFKLYERFDFYSLFFSNHFIFTGSSSRIHNNNLLSLFKMENLTEIYKLFKFQEAKNNYIILHSKNMISLIIEEFLISKGEVIILKQDNRIKGVAFCTQEKNIWEVKELLSKDKVSDVILLELLCKRYGQKTLAVKSSNYFYENNIPKGMIRILNPHIVEEFNEFQTGKETLYDDSLLGIKNQPIKFKKEHNQKLNSKTMAQYLFKNKRGKINLVLE